MRRMRTWNLVSGILRRRKLPQAHWDILLLFYDPRNLEHHLLYHGLLVDPNSQVLQDSVEQKIYEWLQDVFTKKYGIIRASHI